MTVIMDNNMINTERLIIRRVCADDWRAIRQIWAEAAQTEYAQYDSPNDISEESVEARIDRWASFADSSVHMFYAVCLKGTVIGYVALHQREEGYEIGYCFHTAQHGHGYAKESISALANLMKIHGVHIIIARTALNNTPSVRLLSGLGFVLTGREKVSFYKDTDGNDIYFNGGIYILTL